MCYSALIRNAEKSAARTSARIDEGAFLDLFARRVAVAEAIESGDKTFEPIRLAQSLTWEFANRSDTPVQKEIVAKIQAWWKIQAAKLQKTITEQSARVEGAKAKLAKKETKAAANDLRIGTSKVEKAQRDLADLMREPTDELQFWTWQNYHYPAVLMLNGKLIVVPLRFMFRPAGAKPSWDHRFSGAYNWMSERAKDSSVWSSEFGRHHAVAVVDKFRERQDEPGEEGAVKPVSPPKTRKEFVVDPGTSLLVPALYSHWVDPEKKLPDLWTSALATCEPPTKIKAQGINRLLLPMKDADSAEWLRGPDVAESRHFEILRDYEWPEARVAEVVNAA